MNKTEIYKAYKTWAKGTVILSEEDLFQCSVGNRDLYEDDLIVISRLNYLVMEFVNSQPRWFSFYELNIFYKDEADDLELAGSVWQIEHAE